MRLGIVGRCEPRGLGVQTSEVARHLVPDRVLLVEPRPAGWPQRAEWYECHDVTRAPWRQGQLPEGVVRSWLDGLDVVYTAESHYDDRLPSWCSAAGVTLVRHANPEQLAADEVEAAGDTVWWAATDWRLEYLPAGTRVVPMPVAVDRFPSRQATEDGPVRFLHSIGHQAQDDRAGSRCVSKAAQRVRARCELVVRCQDRRLDVNFRGAERVGVTVHRRGVDHYWEQYDGCDVLVLPRRYGGLSLPSQEAMAAGLALVMTDCSPNRTWPGLKVPVVRRSEVRMRCGPVEVCDADPDALADIMSRLAADRDELRRLQVEATAWAEANSWEALEPLWRAELSRARTGSIPQPEKSPHVHVCSVVADALL